MRNQIIKSIKVSGLLLEALSAAAPGNFIRIHGQSLHYPRKCVLLPAGTRRGALPAPAQQDGGLCVSSAASAREQNPPQPLSHHRPGDKGRCRMRCRFPSPSCGHRHPLDGSHRPSLPTFSLLLPALMPLTPGPADG